MSDEVDFRPVIELNRVPRRVPYICRTEDAMEVIGPNSGLYIGRQAQITAVPRWIEDHSEALVKETIAKLSEGLRSVGVKRTHSTSP